MRISDWSSDVCSSDLPQAEQHHADKDEEHQQGYPQGEAQPCHRAYLRSRRSRPPSATRPPAATISPPSQISVTNGFHQICTCQRPSASALPSTARSEEHTSELQSLMRISYAVFCLNKKNTQTSTTRENTDRPKTRLDNGHKSK